MNKPDRIACLTGNLLLFSSAFLYLFGSSSTLRSWDISASLQREFMAAFRDPGTQWMVFLCFGIYCAIFLLIGNWSGCQSDRRIAIPKTWLISALTIVALAYAENYSLASKSTQALIFLGAATLGAGAGVLKRGKLKAESGNRLGWGVLILGILVVLLASASIWNGDTMRSYEYRERSRWVGPWNNPNVFGLLMGTGFALAVGGAMFGFRGWRIADRRWRSVLGAVLRFLAAILMGRGLFHSFSRGAWLAAACGVGYLMIQMNSARAQVNQSRKSETESGDAHLPTNPGTSSPHPSPPFRMEERVPAGRERRRWPVHGFNGRKDLFPKILTLVFSPRRMGGEGESFSCISGVSWFKRNWIPAFVVLISVLILSVWHFRKTEWHPARRALSVANANDFSWRNRVAAWEGTLQMMAEKPWFGLGWNQPEPMYEHYYLSPRLTESAAIQMNDYFMLGATLGIPALFCFGMYIWLSLRDVPNSKLQVPDHHPGARPPRALFFAPSRKTSAAQEDSETIGLSHTSEVECDAHSTAPGAGALPGTLSSIHNPLSSSAWLQTTCRAGAIVLLVGFWFDGGLFKLPTASTFWILLELGRADGVKA